MDSITEKEAMLFVDDFNSKIYEKYQELYKSFKEKNKEYVTKYIESGMALTKSHWKHIKKVFPKDYYILNRLYSRIQFIKKKIPDK